MKLQLLDTRGEVEGVLCGMEGEKADLLLDNQRMAKLLAGSEGDRKDTASLLDRVIVERKDFQRQCKRFKEKGRPYLGFTPPSPSPQKRGQSG